MGIKVVTAVGGDSIYSYLQQKGYEVLPDIAYQDGVLELIKKEFIDILIVYSELSGELDKYLFIEKIKQVASTIKVIVIVKQMDDNYKSFLYSKGVFDIFIDGKSSLEELVMTIDDSDYKALKSDFTKKNILSIVEYNKGNKNALKTNLTVKFQKQQIIVLSGVGSTGKTTIAAQISKILSNKTKNKVLLIDFDTLNSGIHQHFSIKRGLESVGYVLPADKNSSLNYIVDAIDKKCFNANAFEKYVLNSKMFPSLDILTGNRSLYICKNILNFEYYTRILEVAKSIYDYIIIDTSGNIFLDSMQFSVMNASKVFVVLEGNYSSMERTYRLLFELFNAWGVHNKKIQLILNKYSRNSVDKMAIKEFFKEYEIAGYISFSEEYESTINSMSSNLVLNNVQEYYSILEKQNLITDQEYIREKFWNKSVGFKLKNNSTKVKSV